MQEARQCVLFFHRHLGMLADPSSHTDCPRFTVQTSSSTSDSACALRPVLFPEPLPILTFFSQCPSFALPVRRPAQPPPTSPYHLRVPPARQPTPVYSRPLPPLSLAAPPLVRDRHHPRTRLPPRAGGHAPRPQGGEPARDEQREAQDGRLWAREGAAEWRSRGRGVEEVDLYVIHSVFRP